MSHRKLADDVVLRIKADLDCLSDRRIADKYGITESQVEGIAVGHLYADVRPPRTPMPQRFYPGARRRAAR